MSKSTKRIPSRKAALIAGLAGFRGVRLADLAAGSRVHPSVFYRVVRGERTSSKIDRYIARRLGIVASTLSQEKAS